MKHLSFSLFCTILLFSSCNSQDKAKEVETMLNEFYTAYSAVWAIEPIPYPDEHYVKIDSLQKKYCTDNLRKEAKEWFEQGHDIITNDWGIDVESLKSLDIVKDGTKDNTYIVSYYVDSFPVSPDKPVQELVKLYLNVVKEGDHYKIDSVQ